MGFQLDFSLISLLLLGDHGWLVISIRIPQMGHNPRLMGRRTEAQKKLNPFGQNHTFGTWQSHGKFEPFAAKSCAFRRFLFCGDQVLIF